MRYDIFSSRKQSNKIRYCFIFLLTCLIIISNHYWKSSEIVLKMFIYSHALFAFLFTMQGIIEVTGSRK